MTVARALAALALGSLAACASTPSNCSSDSDCQVGSLCIDGTCESEALTAAGGKSHVINVVPPSEDRNAVAGVKPDKAQFSVVDLTWIPHLFTVACDSGAAPSPAYGLVYLKGNQAVSVDLQPPPAGDSTVTCKVSSLSGATLFGTYQLRLHAGQGAGGDFTVSANPASLSVDAGSSGQSVVTVAPMGPFASDVTLSVSGQPSGVTADFDVATISGGSGSATLTVQNTSGAAGDYTLTVTATGGGLTHSASIDLTIPQAAAPPDFAVAASPASISVTTGAGAGTSVVTVTPANGFGSDVSLSVAGYPSGATATFDAQTIAGGSGSATLSVQSVSAVAGSFTLDVTASGGGVTHSVSIALTIVQPAPPPDFSLAANPTSIALTAGGSAGSSSVSVSPLNGFNSDVTLIVSGVPSGASASFNPQTVSGGSGSSSLSVQAGTTATPGNYTLTVTASGGGVSHTASVSLSIAKAAPPPDFSVSANPTLIAVTAGGSGGSSRITAAPLNGFSTDVTLTVSGVPSGASASFDNATIAGGSGSSLLTAQATTAAAGSYTLTVTASGGGLTHSATISFSVSAAAAVCGNGIREAGEQCDDGNTTNLDGCDDKCQFEQDHRANSVTMQFGTSSMCTANALGGAISSSAQSQFQTSVNTSVTDGALTMAFKFMGLTDLSGKSSQSFHLGGLTGNPYAAPTNETYNGNSDLDWWYATDTTDLDGNRDPTSLLPASISGMSLSAGPGRMSLTLAFGGGPVPLSASSVRIAASIGSSSTPTESTATPGHLAAEHLDPSLVSFASMSNGQFCGNLSALSLSKAPVPATLLSKAACQGITTSNSLLDLLVAGCKISVIGIPVTVISPTQPDQVDPDATAAGAGGPYRLSLGASSHVTGCADKSGAAVNLTQCLTAAAYSSYLTFATDRVIMKE